MSAPLKPWEGREFVMNQNPSGVEPIFGGTLSSQSGDPVLPSGIVGNGIRPLVTTHGTGAQVPNYARPSQIPPPLPNRNQQRYNIGPSPYNQHYSRLGGYSSLGYGGYPFNSYGNYGGGYSRRMMGGYGLGYPGFGPYQDDFDASMMQAIDDSCQTMFGPFEALVRSFSSIAMVLSSTHQAMQFSFRTVMSAADSLSKLKNLFIDLVSSLSVIRLLRTLYYKILRLLGVVNGNSMKEKEWSEMFEKAASSGLQGETPSAQDKPSPWLALGFFSLMMGGPYLMFKLFGQNISRPKNGLKMGPDTVEGIATYNFDSTSDQELSMKAGDRLAISKSSTNSSWALVSNGTNTGFVPSNRIQILPLRRNVSHSQPRYRVQGNGSIAHPEATNVSYIPATPTPVQAGVTPPNNAQRTVTTVNKSDHLQQQPHKDPPT